MEEIIGRGESSDCSFFEALMLLPYPYLLDAPHNHEWSEQKLLLPSATCNSEELVHEGAEASRVREPNSRAVLGKCLKIREQNSASASDATEEVMHEEGGASREPLNFAIDCGTIFIGDIRTRNGDEEAPWIQDNSAVVNHTSMVVAASPAVPAPELLEQKTLRPCKRPAMSEALSDDGLRDTKQTKQSRKWADFLEGYIQVWENDGSWAICKDCIKAVKDSSQKGTDPFRTHWKTCQKNGDENGDDVRILIMHGGAWVESEHGFCYKGKQSGFMYVSSEITYDMLVDELHRDLCIDPERYRIKIKHLCHAQVAMPPVEISNDDGVRSYLDEHSNLPLMNRYPLCVSLEEVAPGASVGLV